MSYASVAMPYYGKTVAGTPIVVTAVSPDRSKVHGLYFLVGDWVGMTWGADGKTADVRLNLPTLEPRSLFDIIDAIPRTPAGDGEIATALRAAIRSRCANLTSALKERLDG